MVGGDKAAVFGLTYDERKKFFAEHPRPVWTEVCWGGREVYAVEGKMCML